MCSEGPVTPGDFCLPLGSKEISTKSKTILGTPGFVGFQVLTPYNKVILLRAQHEDSKLRKKISNCYLDKSLLAQLWFAIFINWIKNDTVLTIV